MKIILILLLANTALASDKYTESVNVSNWHSNIIHKNVVIKSRYRLSKRSIRLYSKAYAEILKKFKPTIRNAHLEIRVVSVRELSNKLYFPDENEYSDYEGNITGRYFRNRQVMYMVPIYKHRNWKANLAHELAHHFYNVSGVKFINDDAEHSAIRPFEEGFR